MASRTNCSRSAAKRASRCSGHGQVDVATGDVVGTVDKDVSPTVAFRATRATLEAVWWRAGIVLVVLVAVSAPARAAEAPARTGAEVWEVACAACHGADGAGQPRDLLGFDAKMPDLRDCTFATSEPTQDWFAVVHEGGPVRGLDRMMPAYGTALSDEEIARVVDYSRGFCRQLPDWPLGDLNLPRALFTEKAFPENEIVLSPRSRYGARAA